jgi:hypothetical protein
MSHLRYGDFMVEIADLATDILDDIRQQTAYYRASVYKSEAISTILRRVDHLAFVSRILKDDALAECVTDYRAAENHSRPAPNAATHDDEPLQSSECLVTMRVMRLLFDAGRVIESMRAEARAHGSEGTNSSQTHRISTTITRHRRDLMAMSRQGSRAWSFLQSL